MTSRSTLPLYLFAPATSLFGNSAIAIVLPWLVLSRTGDPALTGLVAAVSAALDHAAAPGGTSGGLSCGARRSGVHDDGTTRSDADEGSGRNG